MLSSMAPPHLSGEVIHLQTSMQVLLSLFSKVHAELATSCLLQTLFGVQIHYLGPRAQAQAQAQVHGPHGRNTGAGQKPPRSLIGEHSLKLQYSVLSLTCSVLCCPCAFPHLQYSVLSLARKASLNFTGSARTVSVGKKVYTGK